MTLTTHDDTTLTELKVTVVTGEVRIDHASGRRQSLNVDEVLKLRSATQDRITSLSKELETFDKWLIDMGYS